VHPQHAEVPVSPPTLTAVVCAYTLDRWDDLRRAVQSLLHQNLPLTQVIVVSDYNDELDRRARDAFPGVDCLMNDQAKGLSGARNTGIASAKGDIVAFLDDDAYVDADWSQGLLGAYTEEVIGVGGRVVPEWRASRPTWLPEEFLWVIGCSYLGQPSERAEVRNAIGANMSFRNSVFSAIGGFDPRFGRVGANAAGCEETEFSIRAAHAHPGSKIVLEPLAVCHHSVTADRVTRSYFRKRCRAEGVSKAVVAQVAGSDKALGSERTYATRVLPAGVLLGLRRGVRGDRAALGRSWAIVEGLSLTTFAYLRTSLTERAAVRRA
jgi:glycosyltransferase involved in cell wall biosynthesis